MKIFSAENITKVYGEKRLFENISFHVNEKERIGIIGVNGTGKSSLLKLIAHIDDPDSGTFSHPRDYSIYYLSQAPEMDNSITILDQVFNSDVPTIQLVKSYEGVLLQLERDPENSYYQNTLFELQKEMDAKDGWEASTNAKIILSKLGLTDLNKKIGVLSGGQKKRVALAQALIETPDLLLLDEPTNHLDYETIKWLEGFLNKYPKAVMLVTHDRYFLDQTTTRILELDYGRLFSYDGNYEAFIEAKAIREEQELQTEDKRRNLYRNELAWMKRGAKARSTKQKARIQRFDKLEDDLGKVPNKANVDISIQGSRLGKQVFEFIDASKSFNDQVILKDFNILIKPGDRYGIVGKNGSGKSSFLNLLSGKLNLDDGELIKGQTVKIAYYTQENAEMDENMRMISYIREVGEVVETNKGETISAAQMLERFLFPMSTHGTIIKKLSGGEKRRLYLLRLLMSKPNVLLLDEPTNDLDTATLTIFEQYIEEFPGVVISVSHDRYFLDKTANQLLVFQGNGQIDQFYGTYSEYLETEVEEERKNREIVQKTTQTIKNNNEETKKKRMSFNEKREWESIEDEISETETKLTQLTEELDHIGSDFEKAQKLMNEIDQLNIRLEHLISRWSYLSELV
ncbi:ABC-F family ATP-binding cassette domain-containing protein [Lederbergia wuyishanensis]|uniref:ATP-binding cassette subfamily F protein uup n=1 Tax=Lederbergia wuyishanensis TaxID=1347903 RepID=A0ABU0D0S1_9BACI|nr:ABC-F family ATP-binding cassette domain-containing protein [Lederbergia wuyishanensis]MCJ8006612.1 ABC-F family ATP-binding cassette domain-containing protein [Lederbergia wuyishanensis]MDQ0341993.1 ATP-binding cassette subfamily F protein uup [Lederbergia wuyishanensis]